MLYNIDKLVKVTLHSSQAFISVVSHYHTLAQQISYSKGSDQTASKMFLAPFLMM